MIFKIIDFLPVKFYTLDDSVMFTLRRIIHENSCGTYPIDDLDDGYSCCSD